MRISLPPAVAFAMTYVALFGFVGVWMPYWPIWLAERGYDYETVGWLLALASWGKIAANPLTARHVARAGTSRRLLANFALAACLGYAGLLAPVGLPAIVLLSLAISLALSPITALIDGLALSMGNAGRLDYGRVRLWGSASFVATTLVGGWVVDRWGSRIVVPTLLAACSLTWLAIQQIPQAAFANTQASTGQQRGLRVLLAHRPLRRLIGVVTFLNASHALFYGFGALMWQSAGLDSVAIGGLWAESVLAEILFFWLASRLLRGGTSRGFLRRPLTPTSMLMFAAVAGMIRWTAMSQASSLWLFAILQLLHAFTFGAQHMGQLEVLAKILPRRDLPPALTLSSAMIHGVASAIATPMAGYISQALGTDGYLVMAGFSGLALAGTLWSKSIWDEAAEQLERATLTPTTSPTK